MKNASLLASLASLAGKGARFSSFTYRAKGSGELARHVVALGVNIEKAYRRDLAILKGKLPHLTGVHATACQELIASLENSLDKGIGNNDAYTCQDVYQAVCPGVKIHKENGSLHVFGFSMGKKVIEAGEHKKVKSSEKTLAKKELKKGLKTEKFRQFTFEAFTGARIEGKTLTFE
jgi:hypothetical protein